MRALTQTKPPLIPQPTPRHPLRRCSPKYLTSLDFESPGMELWIDDVYLTDCNLTAPEVGITDFGPPITDAGPAGSPVAAHGRLQVVGTQLQDQSGQAVQLKGVSSFWLNWEGTPYAESLTGLEWMRDNWGLSVA